MILFNAQHIFCNGREDPFIFVNGKQVWPLDFDTYTIEFEWVPTRNNYINLDGMGWGDELSYLHAENVIWAGCEEYGTYTELTTTQIVNSCEDNGNNNEIWCSKLSFNIRGSDVGRFYEFTFKTYEYDQPTGDIKVSIIGYTSTPVVLASKTVSMAADTTYHVHIGEFDT